MIAPVFRMIAPVFCMIAPVFRMIAPVFRMIAPVFRMIAPVLLKFRVDNNLRKLFNKHVRRRAARARGQQGACHRGGQWRWPVAVA